MTIKEALEGAEFVPAFPGDEDPIEEDITLGLHKFESLVSGTNGLTALRCSQLIEQADIYGLTVVGTTKGPYGSQHLLLKTLLDMTALQAIYVGDSIRLLTEYDDHMINLYVKGTQVFIYVS